MTNNSSTQKSSANTINNLSSKSKLFTIILTITTSILTLTSFQNTTAIQNDTSLTSSSFVPVTNLRHNINQKQNDVTATDDSRTMADLRYLTLGSSITYGVGLANRYSAYPYLLSPDRTKLANIAVKITSDNKQQQSLSTLYPSIKCLQQTISQYSHDNNEEYDVIIIQYDIINHDGLYDVTQILRMRYPDAIIVLLCVWTPGHLDVYDNIHNHQKREGKLYDWATSQNVPFYDLISPATLSNHYPNLNVRWPNQKLLNQIHNRVTQDFNAHLFFFLKEQQNLSAMEAIKQYKHYFQNDYMNLSDFGHLQVVRGLQEMIHDVVVVGHEQQQQQQQRSKISVEMPRVDTWMVDDDIIHDGEGAGGSRYCPSLNLNVPSVR